MWERDFSELLLTSPDLWELLYYTFELDPKGKWADQLKGIPKPVISPVGYLKFLLPKIQCGYLDYLETLEHQDGVKTLRPTPVPGSNSGSLTPLIPVPAGAGSAHRASSTRWAGRPC